MDASNFCGTNIQERYEINFELFQSVVAARTL